MYMYKPNYNEQKPTQANAKPMKQKPEWKSIAITGIALGLVAGVLLHVSLMIQHANIFG